MNRSIPRQSSVRLLAIIALAAALVLPPSLVTADAAPANARATEVEIPFRDCAFVVLEMIEESEHVASYIPGGFEPAQPYGPGLGAIAIWMWDCAEMVLPGTGAVSARMTLVTGQVVPPGTQEIGPIHPDHAYPLCYLACWDYAVVAGFSDSEPLAALLRSAGLPFERADIRFEKTPGAFEPIGIRHDSLEVAAARERFGAELDNYAHVPEHFHDQSFWGDNEAEGFAQLTYHVEGVTDAFCARHVLCATLWAEPGTLVAEFLRAAEREDLAAYDHNPIASGSFTLRTHL